MKQAGPVTIDLRDRAHKSVDAYAPFQLLFSGETQKPHSLGSVVIRESKREKGEKPPGPTLTHRGVPRDRCYPEVRILESKFPYILGLSGAYLTGPRFNTIPPLGRQGKNVAHFSRKTGFG